MGIVVGGYFWWVRDAGVFPFKGLLDLSLHWPLGTRAALGISDDAE